MYLFKKPSNNRINELIESQSQLEWLEDDSVCASKTKPVWERIEADVESCGDFEMARKLKKNERQ
jgi:hypothetical protein